MLRPAGWQEDTGELGDEECNDCCYQDDGHEGEEGRGEGEAEARHEGDEVSGGGAALLLLELVQPGVAVAQLVAGLVLAVAGPVAVTITITLLLLVTLPVVVLLGGGGGVVHVVVEAAHIGRGLHQGVSSVLCNPTCCDRDT